MARLTGLAATRRRSRRRGPEILLQAAAVTACSPAAHRSAVPPDHQAAAPAAAIAPDPGTAAALVRIAQPLYDHYDSNNDGAVWDRWDARSEEVIPRAQYIRRHAECATEPQGPVQVEDAAPGPDGAWLVDYEIGGQQITDYF